MKTDNIPQEIKEAARIHAHLKEGFDEAEELHYNSTGMNAYHSYIAGRLDALTVQIPQPNNLIESDEQIEAAALRELPVTIHGGKLDINLHRRKSWEDGAKYQRSQMAIAVVQAYRRMEDERTAHKPSEEDTLNAMIAVMQEYSIINESSVVQFHKEWIKSVNAK